MALAPWSAEELDRRRVCHALHHAGCPGQEAALILDEVSQLKQGKAGVGVNTHFATLLLPDAEGNLITTAQAKRLVEAASSLAQLDGLDPSESGLLFEDSGLLPDEKAIAPLFPEDLEEIRQVWEAVRAGLPANPFRMGDPTPDDIRAAGWMVAVHNDYRMAGTIHTFWLFTKGDHCVKGEGRTDIEALDQVRSELLARRG